MLREINVVIRHHDLYSSVIAIYLISDYRQPPEQLFDFDYKNLRYFYVISIEQIQLRLYEIKGDFTSLTYLISSEILLQVRPKHPNAIAESNSTTAHCRASRTEHGSSLPLSAFAVCVT